MATQTKKEKGTIINSTTAKILALSTKANDLALDTTEKVVTKSLNLTEKGLGLSSKLVNKGLEVSAKNQDVVFNSLETIKNKAISILSKSKKA